MSTSLTPIAIIREMGEDVSALLVSVNALFVARTAGNEAEAQQRGERLGQVWEELAGGVGTKLDEIETYLKDRPDVRMDFGYVQRRMRHRWSDAAAAIRAWGSTGALQSLVTARDALDACVLEVSYINIPITTSENLQWFRVGQVMDVYGEVKDQEASREHVQAVLQWMQEHPAATPGIIDASRGVIIKADRRLLVRVGTLTVILVAIACCCCIARFRHVLQLDGLLAPKVSSDDQLLAAYAWGLVGAVAHLLLSAAKEIRVAANLEASSTSSEQHNQASLGNWFLWAHVRYLQMAAAAVWVGVAVVLVCQTTGQTDIVTLLAAGYSFDSIIDLALPKAQSLLSRPSTVVAAAPSA